MLRSAARESPIPPLLPPPSPQCRRQAGDDLALLHCLHPVSSSSSSSSKPLVAVPGLVAAIDAIRDMLVEGAVAVLLVGEEAHSPCEVAEGTWKAAVEMTMGAVGEGGERVGEGTILLEEDEVEGGGMIIPEEDEVEGGGMIILEEDEVEGGGMKMGAEVEVIIKGLVETNTLEKLHASIHTIHWRNHKKYLEPKHPVSQIFCIFEFYKLPSADWFATWLHCLHIGY